MPYLHKDKNTGSTWHRKKEREEDFRGNDKFATAHQLNRWTPSRRDDLQSLVYLMLYLL